MPVTYFHLLRSAPPRDAKLCLCQLERPPPSPVYDCFPPHCPHTNPYLVPSNAHSSSTIMLNRTVHHPLLCPLLVVGPRFNAPMDNRRFHPTGSLFSIAMHCVARHRNKSLSTTRGQWIGFMGAGRTSKQSCRSNCHPHHKSFVWARSAITGGCVALPQYRFLPRSHTSLPR